MVMLYVLLLGLLILALSLIFIPLIRNKNNKKILMIIAIFMSIFSILIYQFSGDKLALSKWFSEGKYHYSLLERFNKLGGVDGAIEKIKLKLETHPDDALGWLILGKLYLTKENYAEATKAFKKSHELQPDNLKAKEYYEMSKELSAPPT